MSQEESTVPAKMRWAQKDLEHGEEFEVESNHPRGYGNLLWVSAGLMDQQ